MEDGDKTEEVTFGIDKDIFDALQTPEPKGWQTRLNALLREAVGLTTPPR